MDNPKNLVLPILALLALFAIANTVDGHDCSVKGEMAVREVKHRFGTCYIKYGDAFIPYDEYKLRAATNF